MVLEYSWIHFFNASQKVNFYHLNLHFWLCIHFQFDEKNFVSFTFYHIYYFFHWKNLLLTYCHRCSPKAIVHNFFDSFPFFAISSQTNFIFFLFNTISYNLVHLWGHIIVCRNIDPIVYHCQFIIWESQCHLKTLFYLFCYLWSIAIAFHLCVLNFNFEELLRLILQ